MGRFLSAVFLGSILGATSYAAPVTLELLLLVDVSGSVNASEYDLQKSGYVNAFQSAAIQSLIANAPNGIAVAYGEWSSGNEQSLLVDWTLLTDGASANSFASSIAGTSRASSGLTGPGSAINWGVPLFNNNFEGTRTVIDVSGDGAQNDGANTFNAATAAFAAGIRVNGLPILTDDPNLGVWYQDNIVTPGGGFLVTANSFADFESAVMQKIGREITPIPEPTTWALMGSALGAIALLRRRRQVN